MLITVNEFAELAQVDRQDAYGFIKFLEATGLVSVKEIRKQPGVKGKGTNVYEVPEKVEVSFQTGAVKALKEK